MKKVHINQLRDFNRFYTDIIGLLDEHILESAYSLPEVRILYEIYHQQNPTANSIISAIHIDKGYLSRILYHFQKKKLIARKKSAEDKRSVILSLSEKGKKEFETLNAASNIR